MEEFENLNDKSSWGGSRPNAGRPKGTKNPETLLKEKVAEEMRMRVAKSADKLLDSQMNLAQGVQMLYKIHTDKKGVRSKPELVTSQTEIEEYLAGEYDGTETDYYFITTERPDNRALDSLFDRTFGKAQANLDIKSDGKALEGLSKKQSDMLNKLLYDKETSNGQSDKGNESREDLSLSEGV